MKPWYRNSTLQMDDPEMEWLQGKDPASCAVWEWLKSDCSKRDTDQVRVLSQQDLEMVCRRLGVSLPTFSQISQNLQAVGWVVDGRLKGWKKWNDRNRTQEEDALRKQVEYWRKKFEEQQLTKYKEKPPHFLPKPPSSPQSEETRGEEIREEVRTGNGHSNIQTLRNKLNDCFRRDPAARWDYSEESALAEVCRRSECVSELEEILEYKNRSDFAPRSVFKLLGGWTKALDEARSSRKKRKDPTL